MWCSSAAGLSTLTSELLQLIASHLTLHSRTQLRCTNKYLHTHLKGLFLYVKGFVPCLRSGGNSHHEAIALNGLALLPSLPSRFDPESSTVSILYKCGIAGRHEMAMVWFAELDGFHIVMKEYDSVLLEVDEGDEEQTGYQKTLFLLGHDEHLPQHDTVMFEKDVNVQELHKILSIAPFQLEPDFKSTHCDQAVRLLLCSKVGASRKELCECARFCHCMLCENLWDCARLYIEFGFEDDFLGRPCVCMITRQMRYRRPGQPCRFTSYSGFDEWSVDLQPAAAPGPVKLDFDHFPHEVVAVKLRIESSPDFKAPDEYILITNGTRPAFRPLQDSMAFVYQNNYNFEGLLDRLRQHPDTQYSQDLMNVIS